MTRAAFIPALNGFRSSIEPILGGFGPRAVRFLLQEAIAEVLVELQRDYWGSVEAYNLRGHLERWVRAADLQRCAANAGEIFTTLDYFNARLSPPANIDRFRPARHRAFQRYFWDRGLENLRANAKKLLQALAITVLLPEEWYPQATLDRQIKEELNRLRIFREISIIPDLGLEPGGLSWMADSTRRAVDGLRESLVTSGPRPLRMIRDPRQLCGNRQVIAYDCRDLPGEGVRFEIYEPDCLCAEHALLVDLQGMQPIVVEHCPPGPPQPLAGLIRDQYAQTVPPEACLTRLQRNPRFRQLSWRLRNWLHAGI